MNPSELIEVIPERLTASSSITSKEFMKTSFLPRGRNGQETQRESSAFTYYFHKVMNPRQTSKDVLKKVRAALTAAHNDQVPQLECHATKRNAAIV